MGRYSRLMRTNSVIATNSYIERKVRGAIKRTVTTVDDAAVARAAGALEGTCALVDDFDEAQTIPVTLTVSELRNFVHYMRTLDQMAREFANAGEEVVHLRKELDQHVQRIKLLETALESKRSEAPAEESPQGEPVVTSLWNRARKTARRKTAIARSKNRGRPEK